MLRRSTTINRIATVFTIALVCLTCILFMTKSVELSKKVIIQKQNAASKESLEKAYIAIHDTIAGQADEIAVSLFTSMHDEYMMENMAVTERDAYERYLTEFRARVERELFPDTDSVRRLIEESLPEGRSGSLKIADNTVFSISSDGDSVFKISGICIEYDSITGYHETRTMDVSVERPNVRFFDGNDAVFDNAMLAQRGIYITGDTSTIIGNIYGGDHRASEMRDVEAAYGEMGAYGGINILATQLGIYDSTIRSGADLNIRSSFVTFGSSEDPVDIYAKHINESAGFAANNTVAYFGDSYLEGSYGYDNGWPRLKDAFSNLEKIVYYYDSDNDAGYNGSYRKIIADTDITLRGDFTGIVMTMGNIFVSEGCNVEGLLIAGDRIYVSGNNNIVSGLDILRKMCSEELSGRSIKDPEYFDNQNARETYYNAEHLMMIDYVDGIKPYGFTEE